MDFQQQMLNAYPMASVDLPQAPASSTAYTSGKGSFFCDETGQLTTQSIALLLGLLFLVLASPPVFQFVSKTLSSIFVGSQWTPNRLLIVHTIVFVVLAFVLLKVVTRQDS